MKPYATALLLFIAMALTTACGAKGYHIATVSAVSAHATASIVQDTATAWECGKPTAPPGECLDPVTRSKVAEILAPTFDLTGDAARLIKGWGPNGPAPLALVGVLLQVTESINKVLKLLPVSAQQRIAALVK